MVVAVLLLTALVLLVLPRAASWDSSRTERRMERIVAQLNAAVSNGDQAGFAELFATEASADRVELIWHNLSRLGAVNFTGDTVERWQVDWQLPGEPATSTHQLRPLVDCDLQSCRLRDIVQHPGAPTPIWLTTRLTVLDAGSVTVLGPDGSQQWLTAATEALAALERSAPPGLLVAEPYHVIELPADRAGFEQVLAAPATDFATIGAITWQQGSASHIVLNPDATAALDPDQRRLLLAHELVHLVTAEWGPPAAGQQWVSEGLAEALSLPLSADEQARSLAVLSAACPLPLSPPADAEFTNPVAQRFAYAWSGAVVGELLQDGADAAALRQLWQESGAQPTDWPVIAVCDQS